MKKITSIIFYVLLLNMLIPHAFAYSLIWDLKTALANPEWQTKNNIKSSKLYIGKDFTSPKIKCPSVLTNNKQGAIYMELTPSDWDSSNKDSVLLFAATTEAKSNFIIYKHVHYDLAVITTNQSKRSIIKIPREKLWEKGKKYTVLVNWNKNKFLELYINGNRVARHNGAINIPNFDSFTIGAPGKWGKEWKNSNQQIQTL